ncbi:glycosyltransferase family 2 protein [Candidatus Saccharibacteria bacterium]|nr:glycosyltransferase family 2 protein [Candidatus Saccharibacteria bacterium]
MNQLVSIITPTYNRAHTIQTAIDSVLAQTYRDWEMIIVDDGSIDNTEVIVLKNKDARIKYLKKENGGASRARNYGIEYATGKWIMYLDSDDELLPMCIETMMVWADKSPKTVFAIPRSERKLELYENGKLVQTIDDSEDTPEEFTIQDIFERNAGFSCNGFMHLKNLYDEGIKWDPDCKLMEDWELMLSIGDRYPDGFMYVPVVLQRYTQRFGSDNLVSQTTYGDWADGFEYIYQKHKNDQSTSRQNWYPRKVEKWRKRQAEFEKGKIPPYHQHYFKK